MYFHEDDYCQVQVLPERSYEKCCRELGLIDQFATDHALEGGGWSNMYLREVDDEQETKLRLSSDEAAQRLDKHGRCVSQVATGYSSHREPATGVRGWLLFEAELFVEADDRGTINAIWVGRVPCGSEDALAAALLDIQVHEHLIVVDWAGGVIARVADEPALAKLLGKDGA